MATDSLITLEIPIEEFPAGKESVEHGSQESASISINLMSGSSLFVVGPNGSGKSALMSHWVMKYGGNIKIIRAHRNNCMPSSGIVMSAEQRLSNERNYMALQKQHDSRYSDTNAHMIINIGLFDLISSETAFAIRAKNAINQNSSNRDEKLRNLEGEFDEQKSTIGKLNNIFKQGSLNIQISISDNQQIQATKNGNTYEAAQLSDGERNALILSCQILCAPEGTIFFIDEPEQHLHRAIASPLLSALISERSDCAFVIFTHELSLVETIEDAEVLVLHGCNWSGKNPTTWDCNLLKLDENIPNNIRRAILGGRKKILFVEGTDSSLDRRLYEVMYPDFTIHPAGSCSEVKQAVRGLKESSNLHWVKSYGIIDHDGRSEKDIQKLKGEGIFALREFSVESLFYGKAARNIIATNKAKELGKEVAELLQAVEKKALASLSDQGDRLAARRCCYEIEREALKRIPDWQNISEMPHKPIEISFPSPFGAELKRFQKFLSEENVDALMERYPIKETGLCDKIAKILHYKTRNDYEAAVIVCAKNDKQFRNSLKSKLPEIGGETG